MQIIGFHGLKRHGKDTAAQPLVALGWHHGAFADALRLAMYTLDPLVANGVRLHHVIDSVGWDGYKDTPYLEEIRRLLQTMGTEVGRELLGQDIWTSKIDAKIAKAQREELAGADIPGFAVTDVRFDDEAITVRDRGGMIVHVINPRVESTDGHKSEKGIDPSLVDATVINDGTIADLHRKVLDLVVVSEMAAAA